MMQYKINPVFKHIVKPDHIEYCTIFSFLKYKCILKIDNNMLNPFHNIKRIYIRFYLHLTTGHNQTDIPFGNPHIIMPLMDCTREGAI